MKDDCRCASSYYSNKPQLKLQGETTNQSTFKAHPITRQPELQVPKVVQRHYESDLLKTSYNSSFTKPPAASSFPDQIDSIGKHLSNKPKNVPFYSDTSYKQSYPRYDVSHSIRRSSPKGPPPTSTNPRTPSSRGNPATRLSSSRRRTPSPKAARTLVP